MIHQRVAPASSRTGPGQDIGVRQSLVRDQLNYLSYGDRMQTFFGPVVLEFVFPTKTRIHPGLLWHPSDEFLLVCQSLEDDFWRSIDDDGLPDFTFGHLPFAPFLFSTCCFRRVSLSSQKLSKNSIISDILSLLTE